MKIAIIGAGSIGLLFGGYLGINHTVTMMPRSVKQSDLLKKEGLTVVMAENSFTTKVLSDTASSFLNDQNLIIVAVKQYDLPAIIYILEKINLHIPLLFLQNGMGHIQKLKELPNKNILVGTVEHGALKINETTVNQNGIGQTNIATYRGNPVPIESLSNANTPSFLFRYEKNWEEMLVKKLLINAMINPLTAILKVKNGQLIANSHYSSILMAYYDEVYALFPFMDKQIVFSQILKVCKNTRENQSSMLADILHNRKTEIEAILGYIIMKAKEKNIDIPITTLLFQMVKGMEEERGE